MSDFYFKKFYDDVKDPQWPEIFTYSEFLNLPKDIINECYQNLGLNDRFDSLYCRDYWFDLSVHNQVFTFNNVGYVPTSKCASTNYINLFKNKLGWQKQKLTDIDFNKTKVFGLIMNPLTRRSKGLTQLLILSYFNNDTNIIDYHRLFQDLESPYFKKFIANTLVGDHHSMPISLIYNDYLDKIHWIPMDINNSNDLNHQIINFCKINNVVIDIEKNVKIHQSTESQHKVFKILEKIFLETEPGAEFLQMYAKDLKFYYNILNSCQPAQS